MAERKKRRRTRRKRMPYKLRLSILITVLVFIVAAAGVMMAPVFNITEVYCEGCNNLKAEDAVAQAQIENGTHILLANIGKARRQLEDNPIVKEASIRRVFPDKICITITERIPAGYVMRGAECIVVDADGVVLEVINDNRAGMIAKELTPEPKIEKKEDSEKKEDGAKDTGEDEKLEKKEESTEEKAEESTEEKAEEGKEEKAEENTEGLSKPYNIPLVAGFECEAGDAGKHLKVNDENKYNKTLEILNSLMNAQLLGRTTYLDVTDMNDVRVVVENRLDIYLGKADNIDYRAKFLAEVINTKISSYEKVVMDYRGDDIFVRPPEDGKDRIYKEKEEDASEDEDSEDSDETSDKKAKKDKKDKDKKTDGDDEEKSDDKKSDKKNQENDEESDDDEKSSENEEDDVKKVQNKMTLDE